MGDSFDCTHLECWKLNPGLFYMASKEANSIETSVSLTEAGGVGNLKITSEACSITAVWEEDWDTSASTHTFILDRMTGIVTMDGYVEDAFKAGKQPVDRQTGMAVLDNILLSLQDNSDTECIDMIHALQRCLGLDLDKFTKEERMRILNEEAQKLRTSLDVFARTVTKFPSYDALTTILLESVHEAELYDANPYKEEKEKRSGVILDVIKEEGAGYPRAVVYDRSHRNIIRAGRDKNGMPVVFDVGYENAPMDWFIYYDKLVRLLGTPSEP